MQRTSYFPIADAALLLALAMLPGCDRSPPSPSIATQQPGQKIEAAADERTNVVGAPKETHFESPGGSQLAEPVRRPVAGPVRKPVAGPELPSAAGEEAVEPGTIVEETWDAYFIQGTRVGYAHTIVATVEEAGRQLVRTRNQSRTTLKRAGQTIKQDMTLTSWETPEGELVRFETRMTTGPGEMVARGRVSAGTLAIDTTTPGKTLSQTIAWPAGTGGFFAAEQSLRKKPLQPGETRTVRGLLPVFNLVGPTVLKALDYETVKLPAGEAKLLKVNSQIDLGGQTLDTVLWASDEGAVLKSLVPAIGQEAVRTTQADALQELEGREFDLLAASVVKLKGELREPLKTKRVVYRAHVTSGKVEGVFAECSSQSVKLIDEQTAEITVTATGPGEALSAPAPKPTDDDLAANNMIQADDPLVVQMAAAAAPQSDDPWEIATALEKYVAATIKKKNFSQAFATAGEVARTLEGDCTEHAVLLAALCRAKQIPCRVAVGLVYYPPQAGFAYHMWNEAYIGDRWIPLDGTLGQGVVAADRLKLADTSLSGAAGLSAMLPVVQVFGRLELEVVSAE